MYPCFCCKDTTQYNNKAPALLHPQLYIPHLLLSPPVCKPVPRLLSASPRRHTGMQTALIMTFTVYTTVWSSLGGKEGTAVQQPYYTHTHTHRPGGGLQPQRLSTVMLNTHTQVAVPELTTVKPALNHTSRICVSNKDVQAKKKRTKKRKNIRICLEIN